MIWIAVGMYALGALLAVATAQAISGTIRGVRHATFIIAWPVFALVFGVEAIWNRNE